MQDTQGIYQVNIKLRQRLKMRVHGRLHSFWCFHMKSSPKSGPWVTRHAPVTAVWLNYKSSRQLMTKMNFHPVDEIIVQRPTSVKRVRRHFISTSRKSVQQVKYHHHHAVRVSRISLICTPDAHTNLAVGTASFGRSIDALFFRAVSCLGIISRRLFVSCRGIYSLVSWLP